MALELDAVRAFLKVAELSSFTRAAAQLGWSKARVSLLIQSLESDLGSRLLQRSTRTVNLTPDGEQLVPRAVRLLQEADELSSLFQAPSALRGRLRVDLPVNLARDRILPRLPEFLAAHPNLELVLSTTDRRVDVLREGFDCVLRVGPQGDSTLVLRRLGSLSMVNCASPRYLAKHGTPGTLEDLDRHLLVHYSSRLDAEPPSFEYFDGSRYQERPMPAALTVNNVDAYHAACLAGLGIVQVPRIGVAASLTSGALVELLPGHVARPLEVSLVHGYARAVPRRVRAFMDWLARVLSPQLG